MELNIDRCICRDTRFADMKRAAEDAAVDGGSEIHSVSDLQRVIPFGDGCGLCRPYVRRMLRTGETVFHEIVADEDEP